MGESHQTCLGMLVCLSVCLLVYLSVYLSARVAQKLLFQLIFTQVLYPWLGHPLRLSRPGSGSGLNNLFNDSSPLRYRKTYTINMRHDFKRAL